METDAEITAHNDRLAWRDIDGDLIAAYELLDGVLGKLDDIHGGSTHAVAAALPPLVEEVRKLRALSYAEKARR